MKWFASCGIDISFCARGVSVVFTTARLCAMRVVTRIRTGVFRRSLNSYPYAIMSYASCWLLGSRQGIIANLA